MFTQSGILLPSARRYCWKLPGNSTRLSSYRVLCIVEPARRLPIPPPEFSRFASQLADPDLQELRPLARAERLLLDTRRNFTPSQSAQIRSILHTARSAGGSLTHCTFQELVLGSEVYSQTYQLPAVLNAQSYLQLYDLPLLQPESIASIRRWLEAPAQMAAIFTSRPSQALPGVFSTPEAEMGAALVGLENLPIIGLGSLLWLSQRRQAGPQAFVKPSPVHVLSALLLALGYPPQTCLEEAAALALDGTASPIWKDLEGARDRRLRRLAGRPGERGIRASLPGGCRIFGIDGIIWDCQRQPESGCFVQTGCQDLCGYLGSAQFDASWHCGITCKPGLSHLARSVFPSE